MEKNNIQSIIFHANIFNYDKTFFQNTIKTCLKFDFDKYAKENRSQEEVEQINDFLKKPPKEQIELFKAAFADEDDKDKDNNNLIGEANKEVIDKKEKTSIRNMIVLIFQLISFSKKAIIETKANLISDKRSPELDNIAYGLLFLDGLIMINIDLLQKFQEKKLDKRMNESIEEMLFSILDESSIDKTSQEIASHILSVKLMYSTKKDKKEFEKSLIKLMKWTFLHSLDQNRGNCLTSNFSLLLTIEECVEYFLKTFDKENVCIKKLVGYMVNDGNINLIYESLFCFWNISNCKDHINCFEDTTHKYLEKIVQVIRTNKIDKVARIGLMIINNVKESETCMEILFNIKFMKTIDILLTHKWNDSCIKEMLHSIYDYLEKNYKSMISFEKYIKELDAGDLKAGSLHTTTFWEDNFKEFEYHKFEYIWKLVEIIKHDGGDNNIEQKSIACFDIGEFARLYPGGAGILEMCKAKDSLLLLIQHKDIELKNKALICLQKIMMRSLNK